MKEDLRGDVLLKEAPELDGFKVLDSCVLYDRVGTGGMGAVYRGRHVKLDIDVAVKCLLPYLADSQRSMVLRFEREARLAARVNHPNVVRVFDVDCKHGIHYLVMEYVKGETVRERVARKARGLPPGEAATIVLEAAKGLGAAHREGIVHRDIKPDNILISIKGEVKLADLGLGCVKGDLGDTENITMSGITMGTPNYMPPEQWDGLLRVGPTGDVWALGATFYFLLVGADAYAGNTKTETMRRVCTEPFPDIAKRIPDIAPEIAEIIRRCTETVPAERYADAQGLADALGEVVRKLGLKGSLHDSKTGTGTSRCRLVSPPPQALLARARDQLLSGESVPTRNRPVATTMPTLPIPPGYGSEPARGKLPRYRLAVIAGLLLIGAIIAAAVYLTRDRPPPLTTEERKTSAAPAATSTEAPAPASPAPSKAPAEEESPVAIRAPRLPAGKEAEVEPRSPSVASLPEPAKEPVEEIPEPPSLLRLAATRAEGSSVESRKPETEILAPSRKLEPRREPAERPRELQPEPVARPRDPEPQAPPAPEPSASRATEPVAARASPPVPERPAPDTSVPRIEVLEPRPAASSLTRDEEMNVRVQVTDDGEVDRVVIAGTPAARDPGSTYSRRVPLSEGPQRIGIWATDRAGNRGDAAVDVTRDRTPPDLALLEPSAAVKAGKVVLRGRVRDAAECKVDVNGTPARIREGGAWELELNLPEGRQTLLVEARDLAGNVASLREERIVLPMATDYPINGFERLGRNLQGYTEYRHTASQLVFVLIPGGTFVMGSSKEERESVAAMIQTHVRDEKSSRFLRESLAGEGPQHSVVLDPFLISKFEVSQRQWMRIMNGNPSRAQGDDLPVESVSWNDCKEFCRRTSLKLPTEAQWEFACRAGTTTPFSFGETITTDQVNFNGNYPYGAGETGPYRGSPVPVMALPPNGFGLHNLHGNIQEWCEDVHDERFYGRPEAGERNPVALSRSAFRSCRGGAWAVFSWSSRSAAREGANPARGYHLRGFRPAYYPVR